MGQFNRQEGGVSVVPAFLEGGAVQTRASVSSAGPLQRELGRALQPSGTLHLIWMGGCVPNKGGWGSFCPVFREGWERNQWRWQGEVGAGEHCPGPGTRASNPTDFGPLSGPGRSSHSTPILVPTDSPSCGDTPTHTHNPPQDCQT